MTDDATGTDQAPAERRDKPPGLGPQHAAVWLHEDAARAYRHRPPHPAAALDVLRVLPGGPGGAVLDVGCGTGALARALVAGAERVDAVDMSQPMIEEGRRLEGGDDPRLRWIHSRVEEADLEPPYRLITAGDSLDWTDWFVTLPRLHEVLAPDGSLVILHRGWTTGAPEETDLIKRYSANQDYRPIDLVHELESRNLFRTRHRLPVAEVWRPTIDEFVSARHATAGCARHLLGPDRTAAFDRALTDLLARLVEERRLRAYDGRLDLQVWALVTWGNPLPAG
jgi:SAM-dependent methyltransferase